MELPGRYAGGIDQSALVGFIIDDLSQSADHCVCVCLVHQFCALVFADKVIDPVDQIIDYREDALKPPKTRFDFSYWAYPEEEFPAVLRDFFEFCKAHKKKEFRCKLPVVSYRMANDSSSLLSPTHDETRWTIDPVTTGPDLGTNGLPERDDPQGGLEDFFVEFNEFAAKHGGTPLLNQTPHLTHELLHKLLEESFVTRLNEFRETRRRLDPHDRLLNPYFKALLEGP